MGSTHLIPDGDRKILLDSVTLIYYIDRHAAYGELASEAIERIVTASGCSMITSILPDRLANLAGRL
jgi:hypothetical protein